MNISVLTTKDLEIYFSNKHFYFGKTQEDGWFLSSDGVFRLDLTVPEDCVDDKLELTGCRFHLKNVCKDGSTIADRFSQKELAVLKAIYNKDTITPAELGKIAPFFHDSIRCRKIYNTCQKELVKFVKDNIESDSEKE